MDRRYELLELLRGQKHWTAETLAEQLGVSERTVRRDLHRLRDLGVEVSTEPGRAGGISMAPGGLLPALRFTDDEAVVLALGLRQAATLGDKARQAAESAFRRLEHVMTERFSERIEALFQTLNLAGPAPKSPTPAASTMLALAGAIQQRRSLEVRYRASDGRISYRQFDPYGLAQVVGYWYVAGYCRARQAIRTFRVDRLDILRELEQGFTPPADFDAVQVIQTALAQAGDPSALTCQVWVQASLEEVGRDFPPARAALQAQGEGVLLTTQTPPEWLSALAVTLLDLGYPLRIIAPPALREAFQTLSQRTQSISEGQVA